VKKATCLVLCFVMALALLSGCSDGESEETTVAAEHSLSVGFGRADITPLESVPLRGYGNHTERMSTEVSDPLYATCVAFTDETDNTVLLIHMDLGGPNTIDFVFAKGDIAKATGIPANQIVIAGTHMHSGPAMQETHIASIPRYNEYFREQMVVAAKAALEDRKPAKLYTAEARPVGYNFVRHYITEDGEVIGDNFGDRNGRELVSHVSEADNQMQLIKITREGGENIVLVNWQGHPHRAGGADKTNITSDIVGAMRTYVEEKMGCNFAYFTGASGNVNNHSRIDTENAVSKSLENAYILHGEQLGQIAIDALQDCKTADEGCVQLLKQQVTLTLKEGNGNTGTMDLYAFSIGDIGFACAPYEMFDTNGMEIKSGSQFETTFVVCYANATHSYMPSIATYQYEHAEEPYEVGKCKYIPGTGELLAKEYVKMLNQLHETRK